MNKPQIIINELDAERLDDILSQPQFANTAVASALNEELDRADIVQPKYVPDDIVSMNSQVTFIDLNSNEELTRTLVYPANAKDSSVHISIMAPIGAALLGLRVGDEITWALPNGVETKIKVKALLYQPESAGDLHR
ncbi:nucleoside diphosphate kinase regulator [Thorsellia kenyensis]|uniref:Nucleoside diphosphate kinase regulator n=1 Tax=Thorsellia kenyensis TaxID=1549888 RepID=A0ABV6C9W0_9GAMM